MSFPTIRMPDVSLPDLGSFSAYFSAHPRVQLVAAALVAIALVALVFEAAFFAIGVACSLSFLLFPLYFVAACAMIVLGIYFLGRGSD